uniref:Beta/gamma crystallin 'Greek key' domain-containing protein n=1 Tax=Pygocentrus nattereri TaxID=42514 RepID=A0AAR2J558_PYGNA
MVGSPICQNSGQTSVHSTLLLPMNLEVKEGPGGTVANNEQLFQYNLGDNNVSHKTNFTSAQTAISESLSGINKGEVRCAVEELGVHVCVTQRENDDTGPNNPAKANTESNNHGHALNLDSGDASLVINNVDKNQVQSISKGLSPSGMQNLDSKQLSQVFEIRDFSEKEDSQTKPVRQSHAADETTAAHPVNSEAELGQSGHTQGLSNCTSDKELSFALVKTYLATVIEDGPSAEMEIGETASGPGLTQSVNLDSSYDFTSSCSAVKVVICDDQSQDHEPAGPSHQSSGRLASLPVSVRAHLDIPGTSSRPQAADLHQGPRGFTIISEEEELDTVFVNDTGPMLSPSTRRAKAYPFSLSPIFEEDSGREDTSREDALHVPPATEEEQRSVEQQASSVLSLLQSVSERLQSSAFSGSEDSEERVEEPEHPQRFLRPLWERCDDDNGTTDEESSFLLQQQLTGKRLYRRAVPVSVHVLCWDIVLKVTMMHIVIHVFVSRWVGYSSENYRGQQCMLEEGEYSDCSAFFSEPPLTLRSCRFLQAVSVYTHTHTHTRTRAGRYGKKCYHDKQNSSRSVLINITMNCVCCFRWVAYSGRCYTGEQFVLEKGQHPGTLDWGGRQSSPLSIRPVRRVSSHTNTHGGSFIKPCFAGESREFESEEADCGLLSPTSFRVITGSWLLFEEEGYCGNQFVLGEGLYPDLISCGCLASTIRSFKPIPYSFSEPSISFFSLSSFEGLETVADSPMETMNDFFTQSLRVNSGLWVVYEFSQFKGRQMLLQTGEYPCWGEYSSWETIGSLHPLRQRRMYMQVRSRALGTALTAERTRDPSSLAKLSLRPADRSLDTQHWIYSQALFKSKVGKGCLSVIGGKACVGARVALWEEHGRIHQRWSLNENGTISPHLDRSLVLDRRGNVISTLKWVHQQAQSLITHSYNVRIAQPVYIEVPAGTE